MNSAVFNPPRRLQPYATATSTKATLAGLSAAGWGMLITPDSYRPSRVQYARDHGMPLALDNGAWTAFTKGVDWEEAYRDKWMGLVELLGEECRWVVAPDIVGGGLQSLRESRDWLPWILKRTRMALLAVQDGMEPDDIAPIIAECDARLGIFLGGTTRWKWETAAQWGELAARWRVPYHIARVNTKRALRIAGTVGATSVDGTGPVQFPSVLERLERERAQSALELYAPPAPCCGDETELWEEPHTGAQYCVSCGAQYRPEVWFGEPLVREGTWWDR